MMEMGLTLLHERITSVRSSHGNHGVEKTEVREIANTNPIRSFGVPPKTSEAETVDMLPST